MPWRLLYTEPADGARNMAVDEALFLSALGDDAVPTVRLYRFRTPTLTFGYAQEVDGICRRDVCRELGVDCVRRPTGGRALLHHHELTYSVASPATGRFASLGVREVYALVSSALASALGRLGVPVDAETSVPSARGPAPGSPRTSLACLALPESHELASGGRKIVASAQRRRRHGFLQHGTVLRRVDRELWERIRHADDDASLAAVGIDELLAAPPTDVALARAVVEAFEELFEEPAAEAALTPEEQASARELELKYRSEAWTVGGPAPDC